MTSVTERLSHSYDAEPGAVARARRDLAAFAASAGATPDQIDSVRLAVSEAVTNAVVHGYRGAPGRVQITAGVAQDELWILITDAGGGMQLIAERPGLGLGLGLIARISDHMTIVPRPEGGTELRMRFDLERTRVPRARAAGGVSTMAAVAALIRD